jgi:hypothetical protein
MRARGKKQNKINNKVDFVIKGYYQCAAMPCEYGKFASIRECILFVFGELCAKYFC